MGFRYTFIGRPATALDLMNVIRDNLVQAGWTLLREFTDGSGNNFKYLKTAPYIMPDNSDAGSAVLELRNPAGTNHVDIKMWNGWNLQTNSPVGPDCPNSANGSYLRLAYSYQAGLYYWLYANEFWFALLQTNSTGGPPFADSYYKTIAGVALPPSGVPTAPPYKALFVASPYNTSGSLIDSNEGTRNLIRDSYRSVYVAVNPINGTNFWANWVSFTDELRTPTRYIGHPDQPLYLFPLLLVTVGEIKYAKITGNLTMGLGTQQVINGETWVNIIAGAFNGHGQIWVRIA